jgi:hypothetical protein
MASTRESRQVLLMAGTMTAGSHPAKRDRTAVSRQRWKTYGLKRGGPRVAALSSGTSRRGSAAVGGDVRVVGLVVGGHFAGWWEQELRRGKERELYGPEAGKGDGVGVAGLAAEDATSGAGLRRRVGSWRGRDAGNEESCERAWSDGGAMVAMMMERIKRRWESGKVGCCGWRLRGWSAREGAGDLAEPL